MQNINIQSKKAKFIAIKYASLRWYDRMWIRARLETEQKRNLDKILNSFKTKNLDKLSYSEIDGIIQEMDMHCVTNDISVQQGIQSGERLPRAIQKVLSKEKGSSSMTGEVTPHVESTVVKLHDLYKAGVI
ncbi:hypothetical protein [Microbulbifer rhizosphaerae]|uniref:Uncharacterized protein n=1 Tax=Microbulbifer rhizosphaerae TaxID=1562603 RepID=A0A7W4ZB41_9GAMM|nr:hypothetical protein [Microbulbifer rhizosphaerae]MBB3063492.1 hypothetical protein [Microbulbifer rhizosphaerae]